MIVASTTGAQFLAFSAVLSGVKEIREVIHEAEEEWKYNKRRTILLWTRSIDSTRLNKMLFFLM